MYPYKSAFEKDLPLTLPLYHLLGNKIGIHVENGSRLAISAWKFKGEDSEAPLHTMAGRIHISPLEVGAELLLIEDYMVSRNKPTDFPVIFERTTAPDLVTTSLFYPQSNQNWNFQIHMRPIRQIVEEDLRTVREEVLARSGSSGIDYDLLVSCSY